jgi:hypothetical protein
VPVARRRYLTLKLRKEKFGIEPDVFELRKVEPNKQAVGNCTCPFKDPVASKTVVKPGKPKDRVAKTASPGWGTANPSEVAVPEKLLLTNVQVDSQATELGDGNYGCVLFQCFQRQLAANLNLSFHGVLVRLSVGPGKILTLHARK